MGPLCYIIPLVSILRPILAICFASAESPGKADLKQLDHQVACQDEVSFCSKTSNCTSDILFWCKYHLCYGKYLTWWQLHQLNATYIAFLQLQCSMIWVLSSAWLTRSTFNETPCHWSYLTNPTTWKTMRHSWTFVIKEVFWECILPGHFCLTAEWENFGAYPHSTRVSGHFETQATEGSLQLSLVVQYDMNNTMCFLTKWHFN